MNCRGNEDYKFTAGAGFVSNTAPITSALLRARYK